MSVAISRGTPRLAASKRECEPQVEEIGVVGRAGLVDHVLGEDVGVGDPREQMTVDLVTQDHVQFAADVAGGGGGDGDAVAGVIKRVVLVGQPEPVQMDVHR